VTTTQKDSIMAEKLSDRLIKALVSPEAGNAITYDTEVKGLGIRITAAGAKSFIMNYRNEEGRERRLTIGSYGANQWSLVAARKRAGDLRRKIDRGDDPLAEKMDKRTAPTVSDLCERYEADHLPHKRPSSQSEDRRMITKIILPSIGNQRVASIHTSDIEALHLSLKDTPYSANRVLALTSKMFSLALKRQKGEASPWRTDNPCKGVERYPEAKRKGYLKAKEIERLVSALINFHNQKFANVIRLCLLTGCRRGEALNARWDQFDDGIWTKPASTTKQDEDHEVPVSNATQILLKNILAGATTKDDGHPVSPFVFPGRFSDAPLKWRQREWDEIRTAAMLPKVRVHDLRHTFASLLASSGKSLTLIGAMLGHSNPLTTHRYAHLYNDPLKEAANSVGDIITGAPSAEVTPIRKDGVA
jgi:integrase